MRGFGPGIELDTTILKTNIEIIGLMPEFSKRFGDVLIDFDPAQIQGTGNSSDTSIIAIPEETVDKAIDELIEAARKGAHVNSPAKLELARKYLKGEPIHQPCYSVMKDLLLGPNGQVYFCWGWGNVIGNILDPDIVEKWRSAVKQNIRVLTGETPRCEKCGFSHSRWPDEGFSQIVAGINLVRKRIIESH